MKRWWTEISMESDNWFNKFNCILFNFISISLIYPKIFIFFDFKGFQARTFIEQLGMNKIIRSLGIMIIHYLQR